MSLSHKGGGASVPGWLGRGWDHGVATGSRRDRRASDGLPCGRRMVHFSDGVFCGIAPDVVQDQWPACVGGRML